MTDCSPRRGRRRCATIRPVGTGYFEDRLHTALEDGRRTSAGRIGRTPSCLPWREHLEREYPARALSGTGFLSGKFPVAGRGFRKKRPPGRLAPSNPGARGNFDGSRNGSGFRCEMGPGAAGCRRIRRRPLFRLALFFGDERSEAGGAVDPRCRCLGACDFRPAANRPNVDRADPRPNYGIDWRIPIRFLDRAFVYHDRYDDGVRPRFSPWPGNWEGRS